MAYKEFFVEKSSGTYSEMLEAYGLAKLLEQIMDFGAEIRIENIGLGYRITPKREISQERIDSLNYTQVIPFIKEKIDTPIPISGQGKYFDYPSQKAERDRYKALREEISKDKSEQKKEKLKALVLLQSSEFGKNLDSEYDVYREIVGNPYTAFEKLYFNFEKNKEEYKILITEILNYYFNKKSEKRTFKIDEKVTSQQLYSPNQGKGLNRTKADGLAMGNEDGMWIPETMKILGALNFMSCQTLKVGSSYDMKIFVPEFNDITISKASTIIKEFKRHLKSVDPIKLDILNILNFTLTFIRNTEGYQGKVKNTVSGLFMVYQKSLGQFVKSVTNISFIETPEFVDCNDKADAKKWLEILNDQIKIVQSIKEQGDSIQGLLAYRNFLGSSNLYSFFKFSNWYSVYLMQALDNQKYYVKPFKVEILNLFYEMMDKNNELKLGDIIKNEGFLAVANAIRKSTVTLQYTPKDQRKFDIRYGMAQEIQNKSKSKSDLATFIGEFIATYNAQTARQMEKTGKALRKNVKASELIDFYELLDKADSSRLVGALLGSYGFALIAKEIKDDDDNSDNEEGNDD